MLLTRFPLLGPGFWALCWNHNFCCVSTIFNDFDLSLDSGSERESRLNSRFLKNFKHKSQDSDECAALTNHLSLLIKRNVQFFDILSSPIPGIEPRALGWKPGVFATILSWTDWNVKIICLYIWSRCFRPAKNSWIGQQQKRLPKLLDWAPAETRPAKLLDWAPAETIQFELLENSRPPACYFQGNSWKLRASIIQVTICQ